MTDEIMSHCLDRPLLITRKSGLSRQMILPEKFSYTTEMSAWILRENIGFHQWKMVFLYRAVFLAGEFPHTFHCTNQTRDLTRSNSSSLPLLVEKKKRVVEKKKRVLSLTVHRPTTYWSPQNKSNTDTHNFTFSADSIRVKYLPNGDDNLFKYEAHICNVVFQRSEIVEVTYTGIGWIHSVVPVKVPESICSIHTHKRSDHVGYVVAVIEEEFGGTGKDPTGSTTSEWRSGVGGAGESVINGRPLCPVTHTRALPP